VWQRSVQEQGFAIFPELLSQDEVTSLLQDVELIPSGRGKAGIRHVLQRRTIWQLAHDSRLLKIAQEILGPSAFPFRATLFDKSAKSNWLIPWHQDTALPLRERRDLAGWGPWSMKDGVLYAHAPARALGQVLALRIHLDESKSQNGPLRVLPGTHSIGVLNDDEILRLSASITEVGCLVPKGGVLAMRPLLIHASSKSTGDKPRRVVHIEYAASPKIDGDMQLAMA